MGSVQRSRMEGVAMTHDPNEKLCPFVEMDERDYELNCAFYAPPDCQCKLIAKVREDATTAALQRVAALTSVADSGWTYMNFFVWPAEVIAAIEGDQP